MRIHLFLIVAILGGVGQSNLVAQELLGYWQLEETDVNSEAVDSSGNGWNGEYQDDVDPDVEGAPGFGSGAYFDGETGQILIGPGDENGFGDLTGGFTVMAWIKPDNFDTKNRVFGSAPHGGAGWGWGTAGESLQITTWGVKDFNAEPATLEAEEWAHAAVVLTEDNEALFYVNGEFAGEDFHGSEGRITANEFYIGYACCTSPQEHFQGFLDEVGLFEGELTEEQIVNAMNLGVSNFDGGVACDFDGDGSLGVGDVDAISAEIQAGTNNPDMDLTGDGLVDGADLTAFVTGEDKLHTWIGDADLDGEFSSADFVSVFQAGLFETGNPATWSTGDWNGDGVFSSGDFVAAFQDGGFEVGPRWQQAVQAVPEPNSVLLIALAALGVLTRRRIGTNG